jgi:hypothetical protein
MQPIKVKCQNYTINTEKKTFTVNIKVVVVGGGQGPEPRLWLHCSH